MSEVDSKELEVAAMDEVMHWVSGQIIEIYVE